MKRDHLQLSAAFIRRDRVSARDVDEEWHRTVTVAGCGVLARSGRRAIRASVRESDSSFSLRENVMKWKPRIDMMATSTHYSLVVSTNEDSKKRVEPAKAEPAAGRTIVSTKTTDIKNSGFVPGAVYLALDVADKGNTTAIGLLQDVRGELRTAVDSTIDFAENITKAFFRLGRKATQRVDEALSDTLVTTEKLLGGAVRTARDTTKAATDVVVTATSGAIGDSKPIAAA
jgi:hypothetical protein